MTERIIKLKSRNDIRINTGHPWIYSNEIANSSELLSVTPGSLVKIYSSRNSFIGLGYYNRHCLISVRLLSRQHDCIIDENFFISKIKTALQLRERFFNQPYFRLIHSEADGLPGLVIDRFDKVLVCQITTAGMEALNAVLIKSLEHLFPESTIIFRNDLPIRNLEGLESYNKIIRGTLSKENYLIENDLKFVFDPFNGQKTGWFFDQRKNRQFISSIARNTDILDVYCYNGGFGINAKKGGASSVTFIDSSAEALRNAKTNAELNNLDSGCSYITGKAFDELEKLNSTGKKYHIIILDPPAFVKSRKDFFAGIKGYEKLTRIAAGMVAKGGYLFIASCSHNVNITDLIKATGIGINKAGRNSRIIRVFGADIDHPLHPFLVESEYLKSITYQID